MADDGNGFNRWVLALAGALAAAGVGGTVIQYGRAERQEARMDAQEEHRREIRQEIHDLEGKLHDLAQAVGCP